MEDAPPAAAHRQFAFTIPKVLRAFFRHDMRLHGEISRLVYRLVREFTSEAAGKSVHSAAVVVFQSAGEFVRWNPHWHGLFLEGGFDRHVRFVHLSNIDLAKMSACFRPRVIAFFLQRKLLNERLAKCMLWIRSGFSVDASIRIPAGSTETRQALARYIVRPRVSLQKLLDEGGDEHRGLSRCLQRLFPHRPEGLPRHRVSRRGPAALARLAQPTHSHLRVVLLSGSWHLVPLPSPAPPRPRGLETRPSTPAIPPRRPEEPQPDPWCRPSTAAPHGPA